MNPPKFTLKSAGIAKVLLWLLRITLAWEGLSTTFAIIAIALPTIYPKIANLQYFLTIPSQLVIVATLLLSLVWIYRLHDDLCHCYPNYPIDAWDALARFILPGYNIWGIWNALRTIGRYFKAETGKLHYYGISIYRLVPVMYGIAIASTLLSHSIYKYDALGRIESIGNIPSFLVSFAIAGKKLLGLAGAFVLLAIAQTIVNAIQMKVLQIDSAEEFDS